MGLMLSLFLALFASAFLTKQQHERSMAAYASVRTEAVGDQVRNMVKWKLKQFL